jgi:hypothetical protein
MNRIADQDFLFEDTRCSVRVQTTVAKELVNEELLMPHIRKGGLGVGTIIKVQVMANGYDRGERTGTLLHSADFVIEQATNERRTVIDDRGEGVRVVPGWKVVQDSEWKSYMNDPQETSAATLERVPESYVPGEGHIVFNRSGGPKKPKWDVIVDDKVWATVDRLPDETPAEHEARAKSIAAGSIMKPLEAVA